MRVGYMGNFDSPNLRVWVEQLAARGAEPIAISTREPSWDVPWSPIEVRAPRVKGLGIARRDIARQIRDACATNEVSVLHAHEANRLAIWAQSSGFAPRVVTCWGSDVLRIAERRIGYRLGVRRALSTADAVTVGSLHLRQAAVAAGAHPSRCAVVGWGVDTRVFRRRPEARQAVRFELGIDQECPVVLSTRLLEPLYHVEDIVDAFALALNDRDDLVLIVAGDGTRRAALESRCKHLGLTGSVRFLGMIGRGESIEMPDLYAAADVFCSVPETDGGPLSVLEAMAAENAVVARGTPVMREWLDDGTTGLLWETGATADLSRLMLDAVVRSADMGRAARAYVMESHDRQHEMDAVLRIYERLTEEGR